MKKLFTLIFVSLMGISLFAQSQAPKLRPGLKSQKANYKEFVSAEPVNYGSVTHAQPLKNQNLAPNAVSVVSIGSSANAFGYGYSGGQRTIVWYDGDLNTVTNFHRMGGELDPTGYSGDLGYDISTDGGMNWNNMVECYVATEPSGQYYADAARYPQAAIWNPTGNTDPTNAYMAFFAPNLDGSNAAGGASWGGYSFGVQKIGAASNVDTTKNLRPSEGEYHQYLPQGYAYARGNALLTVDINYNEEPVYYQNLILNRGTWSEEEQDIVYEQSLLDAPIIDADVVFRPACIRAAFGPDGQTGYIVMLGNNGENELVYDGQKSYYPMLWKTEDAGETWSEVINVQLDGPDGIEGVLNYMSDAEIDSLFVDPDPARDEIPFTTAFDCDLVVDANGNPHIAVGIGVQGSDDYSILSGHPWYAIFDIWSPDGGETWQGVELGRPEIMRGEYGVAGGNDSYTEDSRVCNATNWDGTKVFFSWVDTDPEVDPDENTSPDVWVRGFDPIANKLTAGLDGADLPTNATFGSVAMWQAYFATMSRYVIDEDGVYTLPITYEDMTIGDPGAPVQFYYIQDFSFTDDDFTIQVGPEPLVPNFEASATEIDLNFSDAIDFTDLSTGGAITWAWEFEGGDPATSNEQNPTVTYGEIGTYDVSLTVGNGTEEVTKEMEDYINVYNSIGINEVFAAAIKMYPNPVQNELTIELPEGNGNLEITIMDNTGRVVANHIAGSKQLKLDLSDYAKGVYMLRFASEGQSTVKKLLVK